MLAVQKAHIRGTLHRPLVNSTLAAEALGGIDLARAAAARTSPQRLAYLLRAARRVQSTVIRDQIVRRLQPYLVGDETSVARDARINWERYITTFGRINERRALSTSLLLKAPGPNGEKGVLYVSFEYNWLKLIAHHDTRRLLDEYIIVGASSYSPTDFAPIASFAGLSDDPLFIGVSNIADVERYAMFRPVLEPLPLMACDWNDPAMFDPLPRESRDVEIVMVANWLLLKRHWLLFAALRRLPRHWRVVLIGRDAPGRSEREIRAEARALGVRQELELHTNLPFERVADWLSRGRVSPLLTDREGSCVAVTEAMFADTPVVMMRDAHVGSKAHINAETGALATPEDLWRVLGDFVTGDRVAAPRAWAIANISAQRSTERLNAMLKAHAERTGRPWVTDITPLCWRYVPAYLDRGDAARMEPAVQALQAKHGVELVKFVYS